MATESRSARKLAQARKPFFAVLTTAALACAVVGAMSSTFATGCYGRACEGDFVVYGDRPGEGRMVDANTWESSAVDGVWIDYRASRTIAFLMPAFFDRTPISFEAYISPVPEPLADPAPGAAPDNFSIATGNLAEFVDARPGGVNVFNATCASYFVRVVVRFAPVTQPPLVPDASSDADANTDAADSEAGIVPLDGSVNDASSEGAIEAGDAGEAG